MIIFISDALVFVKQHISIFYNFSIISNFPKFVIWLAPEHHLRNRNFMIILISGALVLVKQHISIFPQIAFSYRGSGGFGRGAGGGGPFPWAKWRRPFAAIYMTW
jgi:hypothetical protein